MELAVDKTAQPHFVGGPLIRHKPNMYLFGDGANGLDILLVFTPCALHLPFVLSQPAGLGNLTCTESLEADTLLTMKCDLSGSGPLGQEYLEIELDASTSRQVERLARRCRCAPFGMCVRLLREAIALRQKSSKAKRPKSRRVSGSV